MSVDVVAPLFSTCTPVLPRGWRHTSPLLVSMPHTFASLGAQQCPAFVCCTAGITGYPLETLRWLADNSPVPIDSAISYCHHTLHDTSLVTSGTLRHLQSKGLGVINASPLSMGLLTSKGPPDWHVASPQLKAACKDASEFAASRGVDFARIALAFAAGNPVISTTMGSAATMAEIIPNMDLITGKNPLNDEEKLVLSQVRSRFFNEERMTSIASWEGAEVTKYWVKVGKQLTTNMYSGLHTRRKAEKPVRDLYS